MDGESFTWVKYAMKAFETVPPHPPRKDSISVISEPEVLGVFRQNSSAQGFATFIRTHCVSEIFRCRLRAHPVFNNVVAILIAALLFDMSSRYAIL